MNGFRALLAWVSCIIVALLLGYGLSLTPEGSRLLSAVAGIFSTVAKYLLGVSDDTATTMGIIAPFVILVMVLKELLDMLRDLRMNKRYAKR